MVSRVRASAGLPSRIDSPDSQVSSGLPTSSTKKGLMPRACRNVANTLANSDTAPKLPGRHHTDLHTRQVTEVRAGVGGDQGAAAGGSGSGDDQVESAT